ncbi:MAG: hypothetical protein ACLGG7_10850 [Bacteriovoracia bacterium]
MKKPILFSILATLSFSTVAGDIDYSRCSMASGVAGVASIDNDGKLVPNQWAKLKGKSTKGAVETYNFDVQGPFLQNLKEVEVERNPETDIIRISTGGKAMTKAEVDEYKQQQINFAILQGTSGSYSPEGKPHFLVQEPQFWVDGQMIALSKLTDAQAKQLNLGDVAKLKELRSQWRKDKRVVQQLRDGFKKAMANAPLMIPMGQEAVLEIKDGVCVAQSIATKFYNTTTKSVVTLPSVNRDTCERQSVVRRKYQGELQKCGETQMKLMSELYPVPEGAAVVGSLGGGVGGAVGGMVGGGYGGGMMGGYPGMGSFGGFGMYGGMGGFGGDFQCNVLLGEGMWGGGGGRSSAEPAPKGGSGAQGL